MNIFTGHTRITGIGLVVCLLISLSSCGGGTERPDSQINPDITDIMAIPETEDPLSDNLPGADYEGTDLVILTAAEQWQHFYVSEQTGEVVDDAVYARNTTVEERFNVKLDYRIFNGYSAGLDSVRTALSGSVLGGGGDYDLMAGSVSYVTLRVADNLLSDLKSLPYIDPGRPWWHTYVNDELELFGKLYLAAGYWGMMSVSWAVVTFFNKQIVADYNLESPYETVDGGRWTVENLFEMTRMVTADLNGDGIYDERDTIGLLSTWDYMATLVSSMGYSYSRRDAEGGVTLTGADQRIIKINDFLYNMYKSDGFLDGYDLKPVVDVYSDMRNAFAANHALFMIHRLEFSEKSELREMEQYGILPTPKFDEAQEEYITPVISEVAGIPFVVRDKDMSAMILEALNAETYRRVLPAYYDIALMRKYSRDDDSNVMLDLIFENTYCDFCYMFMNAAGLDIYYAIGKTENYASWMAANEQKNIAALEKYMDTIKEMK